MFTRTADSLSPALQDAVKGKSAMAIEALFAADRFHEVVDFLRNLHSDKRHVNLAQAQEIARYVQVGRSYGDPLYAGRKAVESLFQKLLREGEGDNGVVLRAALVRDLDRGCWDALTAASRCISSR